MIERLRHQVGILLDPDTRWCRTCKVIQEAEPGDEEETCRQCIASDENKDVVVEDPYFRKIWEAAQLKAAGIPVMDLVATLDDALAIHAVSQEAERIGIERAREELEDEEEEQQQQKRRRQAGLHQIEE